MTHALRINEDNAAAAEPVAAAVDAIEQLLAQLGPDADCDDAALALWEPARALGEAVEQA